MININEIEEIVLIESGDFNMCIQNLVNDIRIREKDSTQLEIYRTACRIIGSLLLQGLITLVKTTFKAVDEETYSFEKSRGLTDDESDLILMHPEKWDEMDVFSSTEVYEIAITDKGREQLELI